MSHGGGDNKHTHVMAVVSGQASGHANGRMCFSFMRSGAKVLGVCGGFPVSKGSQLFWSVFVLFSLINRLNR